MFESLQRILALARKELLAVLKDRRSRNSLLLPPIIQCLIFGYAATYDLNHVPYAVLDQDRTAASRELLAGLDGAGVFERVANLQAAEDIGRVIDDRRALLVIQINRDFEKRLLSGQTADVQLIADGRNSNTAGTATGYVNAVIENFNSEWRSTHALAGPAVSVVARAWYNPNFETRWNMIPGMIGTLTLLQTLMLTAMSVAREREQGTFDQLLVTPLRPVELMAGKALPSILIGTLQATGVLLVAQLWFHIPFAGSFFTLYTGLLMFVLAAVGIGLLVSSVSYTMQQSMLFSFLIIMPFTLLSGLTTPLRNMPLALQYFTLLNPLRYAIDITQRVYLEGATLVRLLPDLWPLAVIATVTLSAASWMFRHRLQ
ncbi:MAG TPA: ABC transporter permease [Steroidobacteraceae bacterium]|nr:ABC transporter permease [Steroidobacteraceae bacterium]